MIAALDEVELEEPARAALKSLFDKASAYPVNTSASPPAPEIAHPEISHRWEAQIALDEAVSAIRRRDAARAIALAEHANPAAFTALLGEMIRSGQRGLLAFVRERLAADPSLAHSRYYSRGTLLHRAAGSGEIGIVEFLLALGVEPDTLDSGGHTPSTTSLTSARGLAAPRFNRNAATADGAFAAMCESFNQIGALAKQMGFRAGLHNHMGQVVQNEDELDRCMAMTDPSLFRFSPDTAHLYLAGIDVVKTMARYRGRLMMADYKDARHVSDKLTDNIFDLGDGEVDFPGCHRVLKRSTTTAGPASISILRGRGHRVSYERCGPYIVNKLEPIYA